MTLRSLFRSALFLAGSLICLPALFADETRPKQDAADDAALIQGAWVVAEMQQTDFDSTELRKFISSGGYKITFTKSKMIHSPDESEAQYRLNTTKTPKVLEILEDGRVLAKAIYELKGDNLKFCMGRKSDGGTPEAPRDFDIENADSGTFPTLFVLKRETSRVAEQK
jgi:uncharacterized protein (TIGR03067 family)